MPGFWARGRVALIRANTVGATGAAAIFALAAANGLQVRHLRQSVPTLEDAFARVIGGD